jgi:hypothetical protein
MQFQQELVAICELAYPIILKFASENVEVKFPEDFKGDPKGLMLQDVKNNIVYNVKLMDKDDEKRLKTLQSIFIFDQVKMLFKMIPDGLQKFVNGSIVSGQKIKITWHDDMKYCCEINGVKKDFFIYPVKTNDVLIDNYSLPYSHTEGVCCDLDGEDNDGDDDEDHGEDCWNGEK